MYPRDFDVDEAEVKLNVKFEQYQRGRGGLRAYASRAECNCRLWSWVDTPTQRNEAEEVLSVLQGDWAAQWQLVYDEGVKLGNGTESDREEARKSIELLRDHHKGLCYGQVVGISGSVYSAFAPGMYHDLVPRKPELVAQAVQVLLRCPRDTRKLVTLPSYKAERITAVNVERSDGREAILAAVVLQE